MNRFFHVLILVIFSFSVLGQSHRDLKFIENKNQWPADVDFIARVPGGKLLLKPGHFSVYLFDESRLSDAHQRSHGAINESDGAALDNNEIDGHHVQINFLNSNSNLKAKPAKRSEEYYNYFLGNDPARWASRAYAFEEITYPGLYDGVDLRISSVMHNLKYDFVVEPDADPSVIQIKFNGADEAYLDHGNLIIKTSVGYLIEKKPFTYQIIDGRQCEVPSKYQLTDNVLTFDFPEGYDLCYELVIDPLLIFSTFSGSTADNWGSTATPGENGTLYSSGITNHINVGGTFPATPGAFQTQYGGFYDISILKYDSAGKQMLYASYLGGSGNESPHSLIMDPLTEDLMVLGTSGSNNFPTTASAFQKTFQGGPAINATVFSYGFGSDITLSRISRNGDQLLASTYLGGSSNDGIYYRNSPLLANYGDDMRGDILIDSLGFIYVTSVSMSTDFPVMNSFGTIYNGGASDAVVVKLNSSLSSIEWSAFLGGNSDDASYSIKLDADYNLYVAGGTTSANFPITTNVYQTNLAGGVDGWIARLAKDGSTIEAATFTGTSAFDQVYFVDLDADGDIYVYGQTNGNIPVTPGVYFNPNSGQFVQRFKHNLDVRVFSTRFGSSIGIPNISPTAFLVNECNNLYMAGWGGRTNFSNGFWQSTTHNMPTTSDAIQRTTQGNDFYFMVLTNDASELLYATFLGGSQSAIHVDGGTSRFDKSGIVYHAVCAGCGGGFDDFPTTIGAWSRTNNSLNCNNAAFKLDLSTLRARLQTNSVAFSLPGLDQLCYPDSIRFQNLSTGGELYEWDLGDGTKLSKTDTTSFVHQYATEGIYIVKLKAIDLNTCIGVDSVSKAIRVFQNNSTAQGDDEICEGTSYQLTASGGVVYNWSTDEGPLISTQVTPDETVDYYVTITDSNGCLKKDTVEIRVVPSIDVQYEYDLITDCFSRPQVLVLNKTEIKPDETLLIDFGDGYVTDMTEATHAYLQDGMYTIRVTGIKEFCVYEQFTTLPIYTLRVPNIITPDATPGYNDRFIIQYGEKGNTPADVGISAGLTVYNRWGVKVYESSDYQYDWTAKGLEAGVYYYSVTLDGKAVCKSWVHVAK